MKKQYKSSKIKNHKITNFFFGWCSPKLFLDFAPGKKKHCGNIQ